MEILVLWSAVKVGVFYGLAGLAYMLIARSTALLNFSVGAYVMLAAVADAYFTSVRDVPVLAAAAVSLLIGCAAAVATEAVVVRPIIRRSRGLFAAVMAIVALLFVLEQVAAIVFGRQARVAEPLVTGSLRSGTTVFTGHEIVSVALALLAFLAVALWARRGRYGRMLRAVGDNEVAAVSLGLPVRRVRYIAMAAAGLVSGLAGVLIAPQAGVGFESATRYAIVGFIALVVGGAASVWGPLFGGLLLGFLEAYGARYFGGGFQDYILLALVLFLFTFRPEGLFSARVRT